MLGLKAFRKNLNAEKGALLSISEQKKLRISTYRTIKLVSFRADTSFDCFSISFLIPANEHRVRVSLEDFFLI